MYRVFGHHGNPSTLHFWIPLLWIPFYIHLSTTTFAVLAGANIASSGKSDHSHVLNPLVANSLYLGILPVVVTGMVGTGVWTGYGWKAFADKWQVLFDTLGDAARDWDGTLDPELVKVAEAQAESRSVVDFFSKDGLLTMQRCRQDAFFVFVKTQQACAIVYIVSAAILILVRLSLSLQNALAHDQTVQINVVGGFRLLTTLRQVSRNHIIPRDARLVAPLQPFPLPTSTCTSKDSTNSTFAFPSPLAYENGSVQPQQEEANSTTGLRPMEAILPDRSRLKRLEWDVTLFFIAVVPSCLAFIGFSAWLSTNFLAVLMDGRLCVFPSSLDSLSR